MGPFNNREIATAIWLIVFLSWALRKAGIRRSLAGVVRAFCRFKIVASVCLMLVYAAAAVGLLAAVGFWKIDLLKDTMVWFCVSAMAMMVRFVASGHTENMFGKVLVDAIKIVVVLEFLVNTYSFSLAAELIIVPILTLIAVVDAAAGLDDKYSDVAKLTKAVQAVVGFVILTIVLSRAIHDLQTLRSLDTLRSIALAPLLSLLLCPFLYVMVLISKYELVFVRLDLGIEKGKPLKQYARRRIVMHAGLSLRRLQHLLRKHAVELMGIQTRADVDRLVERRTDS